MPHIPLRIGNDVLGYMSEVSDQPPADISDQQPAPALSLIATQREAMRQAFAQAGIDLAGLRLEMLTVARNAAADGEYQAAGSLYKTIAQTLGGLQAENHLHLHANSQNGQQTPANSQPRSVDFRATPDDQLRALIERARNQQRVIETTAVPEPSEPPHAV